MKAEQSRTAAISFKEEIIHVIRNFIKTQVQESKKVLNQGARNDFNLKALLEKLEIVSY